MPDDYSAHDPRELPQRIVTVKRTETGRELITYWKRTNGPDRAMKETLVVKEPYRWSYDVLPSEGFLIRGFRIHDEFSATPDGTGARVDIESTVTFTTPTIRIVGPLLTPLLKRMMRRSWADAVLVCDDAAAGVRAEIPASSG